MLGESIDSIIDGHHKWMLMTEQLKIIELSRVRSRATEIEPELKFFFEKRRNQKLITVIDITEPMEPVISYEPYPVVWFIRGSYMVHKKL